MRTAIYCRVSSAGQEENYSLATQEASCRAYAAEQGWGRDIDLSRRAYRI